MSEGQGIIATTEEKCPETGYWMPIVKEGRRSVFIEKGQKMPLFDGKVVSWSFYEKKKKD